MENGHSIIDSGTPELDNWLDSGVTHALIDVDNTLVKANIAELYLSMKRTRFRSGWTWRLWLGGFAALWAPIYLLLDAMNREWFQRAFYRRLREFTLEQIEEGAEQLVSKKCESALIAYTHHVIPYLQQRGVNVILLSTNIEPVVRRIAAKYGTDYLCLPLLKEGAKARVGLEQLRDFKRNHAHQFPANSVLAIADSKHDLPVLQHAAFSIVIANRRSAWQERIGGISAIVPRKMVAHHNE